jgi:hypothetical protein
MKNSLNKAILKQPENKVVEKQKFFLPSYGVTIEAETIEEAVEIAKHLKK